VSDTVVMQVLHRFAHLFYLLRRLGLAKSPLFLKETEESTALHVLKDEVEMLKIVEGSVESCDVFVVAEGLDSYL
jgi:hypothetical protein